ncbi:MAG: hypothetical protein ACPL7D_09040 [Candidatus Sumerlaeaceae bacterium]
MKTAWLILGIASVTSVGWTQSLTPKRPGLAPEDNRLPGAVVEMGRVVRGELQPAPPGPEAKTAGMNPRKQPFPITSSPTPTEKASTSPEMEISENAPAAATVAPPAQRASSLILGRVKQRLSIRKSASPEPRLAPVSPPSGPSEGSPQEETPEPNAVAPVPVQGAAPGQSIVRTGDYSPIEQTVAKYHAASGPQRVRPSGVSHELRNSTARIRTNFTAGDAAAVQQEADSIRARICTLRSLDSLTLEKRLKVSSICRMLDDGLDMVEQGQRAGDETMVQLGLEKIHQASELLEPLDGEE